MEVPLAGSLVARSIKRPYHQQHHQESAAPFLLTGVQALLFDDDELAAFINSPAALLPWNGDQSLLIDRYDVRHLLQDLSGIRKRRPAPPLLDATEEELNYERYRDLEDLHSNHHGEGHQSPEEPSNSRAGRYQAVPFSYSAKATESGRQSESANRNTRFLPPFPVPDFLLSKLPSSEKLHQIMVGTAKFVNEHGGQSEILLKVKQGNNPMFGFLNTDHLLHEYYRYLVQHPELLQPVSQNCARPADVVRSTGEGLSLLGSAYGTVDDDDEGTGKSESVKEDMGPVSMGDVLHDQEGLKAGDGSRLKVDGIRCVAAQDAAVAASPYTGRLPGGLESKAMKGASESPSQSDKKKKIFVGTKEFIQPNKNIVPQLSSVKVNGIHSKDAAGTIGGRLSIRSESKASSWQSVPSCKEKEYGMSADAAAAVVLAATRGVRGFKQDSSNNKSSSSSGMSLRFFDTARQLSASGGSQGFNASAGARGLGHSEVSIAKAMAQAAAFAAAHEADSADALLAPAEKLKAERLRRAKMFAAMIKSGKCASELDVEPAGPLVATVPAGSEAVGSGSNRVTDTGIVETKGVQALKRGWNQDLEELAAKITQTENRFTDAFPEPVLNRKPFSTEEVEDSDVNKGGTSHENSGFKGKQLEQDSIFKERNYRKSKRVHGRESTEYHRKKLHRNDSEESERHKKKKPHGDHGVDEKHRHSKHKKHEAYHSDSADTEYSNGHGSKDYRRSRDHISEVEDLDHYRRRSHHDHEDVQDGLHRYSRHKNQDDDPHSDSADEKRRRRKRGHKALSSSEDLKNESRKAVSGQEEKSLSPAYSKVGSLSDDRVNSVTTADVPAEIRAKVRAMLLSTL